MPRITVLGSFVADLTFRAGRLPAWGETVFGDSFAIGPGGKGSNQAVAAARLGADVAFITKLGRDLFGDLARRLYAAEGIDARFAFETTELPTGAASVVVHSGSGENAIVVVPGSGMGLTCEEIDRARDVIAASAVLMLQLELPLPVVSHSLALARLLGVTTVFNPAPALPLSTDVIASCDYLTPNEAEAAALVGHPVRGVDDAARAAEVLVSCGARHVVITLGGDGALVRTATLVQHVPAFHAGAVVETTGAGDAFNGGLAVALAEGKDVIEATRFGCAVAGIAVTRPGTAHSMPARHEVDSLLS